MTREAQTIYNALRHLAERYQPHQSGGYTADDIAHVLRRAAIPRDELFPLLDELETAGLLRYTGDDDSGRHSTFAAIPQS